METNKGPENTVPVVLTTFFPILGYYFCIFFSFLWVGCIISMVLYQGRFIEARCRLMEQMYLRYDEGLRVLCAAFYLLFFFSTIIYRFIRIAKDGSREVVINLGKGVKIFLTYLVHSTMYTVLVVLLVMALFYFFIKLMAKLEIYKNLFFFHAVLSKTEWYRKVFLRPLFRRVFTPKLFEIPHYITIIGKSQGRLPISYFIYSFIDHCLTNLTLYTIVVSFVYDYYSYEILALHIIFKFLPFSIFLNVIYKMIKWVICYHLIQQGWLQEYHSDLEEVKLRHIEYIRNQYLYIPFDL
jgi:hypothetical protein